MALALLPMALALYSWLLRCISTHMNHGSCVNLCLALIKSWKNPQKRLKLVYQTCFWVILAVLGAVSNARAMNPTQEP